MLKPDKRPLLVRAINVIAGKNRSKLNVDRLIKKARTHSGLKNFGQDFRDDALQQLIASINAEARLHPFGAIMIREKLTSQLENRLWVEHWINKYPEIEEKTVLPIYLITGLQRTGTTKMQRLLSSLSGARGLYSWEALYPAPYRDESEKTKRINRTRRNERAIKWLSPTFHSIHPIHHDQPEEDVLLLDLHFLSSSMEAIMHVPSYASWLAKQDQEEAYSYESKVLKLLQWQRSGDYWILKSPHHLEYMNEFSAVFKDSTIVWMHREPEKCIPSYLSMLFHSRRLFSNDVNLNDIKSHWLPKIENMLKNGSEFRSVHLNKILDVHFKDFVRDELRIVCNVMNASPNEYWDESLQELALQKYESRHQYNGDDWELDASWLNENFKTID